jgi:activating signal cointegrator 1
MKALTLTQPWASLVALGEKRIETRSWSTNYTGLLAIHAAKSFPGWAKEACKEEPFYSSLRVPHANYCYPELCLGHVLCTVNLMGCRRTEDVRKQLTPKELAFGDYEDGRFAWFLTITALYGKPIPARGSLGLWEWNE